MTGWLSGVRDALDSASNPVAFFVRDDDVGWADDHLFALLDVFARCEVPIDLAVIPLSATPELAARLRCRPQRIDVHQHGYAHINHEPTGRKCEFGPSRSRTEQCTDIASGWQRLCALFDAPRRIFTPPWNRCTLATAGCIRDLRFSALSRDLTAGSVHIEQLAELPISFDWFAQRKGIPLDHAQRGALLAQRIATSTSVGIMLHHALMDATERDCLADLLQLLCAHPRARLTTMADLLQHAS